MTQTKPEAREIYITEAESPYPKMHLTKPDDGVPYVVFREILPDQQTASDSSTLADQTGKNGDFPEEEFEAYIDTKDYIRTSEEHAIADTGAKWGWTAASACAEAEIAELRSEVKRLHDKYDFQRLVKENEELKARLEDVEYNYKMEVATADGEIRMLKEKLSKSSIELEELRDFGSHWRGEASKAQIEINKLKSQPRGDVQELVGSLQDLTNAALADLMPLPSQVDRAFRALKAFESRGGSNG